MQIVFTYIELHNCFIYIIHVNMNVTQACTLCTFYVIHKVYTCMRVLALSYIFNVSFCWKVYEYSTHHAIAFWYNFAHDLTANKNRSKHKHSLTTSKLVRVLHKCCLGEIDWYWQYTFVSVWRPGIVEWYLTTSVVILKMAIVKWWISWFGFVIQTLIVSILCWSL